MFSYCMVALFVVSILIARAAAATSATPQDNVKANDECISPSQCGLNGCVVDSLCVCDAGWVGSQCGVLDLAPATISSSYIPPDGVSSSWGMSTVYVNATYHGFVSEFLYKCNLDSWGSNSYINHVVSPTYVSNPRMCKL